MLEFFGFIILLASMVAIAATRELSTKRRWWSVLGILVSLTGVYLWKVGPTRVLLNLLLFFEWHPMAMTALLVLSMGTLVFAWQGRWTARTVAGGALIAGGVALLLGFGWHCALMGLAVLSALGLLWFSRAASAKLGWKLILMIVFLAAGLFVTYLVHGKPENQTSFWVAIAASFVVLLLAWRRGFRILASVCMLIIVVVSAGLLLYTLNKPVPYIVDTVGDYVMIGLGMLCAYVAVQWVRRVPKLQPLGWASALMIAFLGTGLFLSTRLYGEPEDFAMIEDQFKYGSIGSDHFLARGITYFIWEVLPKEWPPEKIIMENVVPPDASDRDTYRPLYGARDGDRGHSYEAFGLINEDRLKPRDTPARRIVRDRHVDLRTFRVLIEEKSEPIVVDRPIGFSKRRVFGMDFVGINCAFCHASTIQASAKGPQTIVLGMPANTVDIELFFLFLFGATDDPGFTSGNLVSALVQGRMANVKDAIVRPDRTMNSILKLHPEMELGRQVYDHGFAGLCQEIRNAVHRMAYRFVLIPLTWRYATWLNESFDFIDPKKDGHFPRFGPGRVDAWSPGKRTLVKPSLPVEFPGGIIDHTSIWNQKARTGMRFHWDGNTNVIDERNIIAGLVVNGPNIETLDLKRVLRITDWISERPAPRFDDFAPSGNSGLYDGEVTTRQQLVQRREEGRQLFQQWCASCHAVNGDHVGRVEPIEARELGTDPARMNVFTTALQSALNSIERQAPHPEDAWKLQHFRTQQGYANMLLDGIWLRAPYLHNGSVLTLRDLLEKPEHRPAQFYRGNPIYDWQKVGFKYEMTLEPGDHVRITAGGGQTTTLTVDEQGTATAFGVRTGVGGLTEREAAAAFKDQLHKRIDALLQEKDMNSVHDLLREFGLPVRHVDVPARSGQKTKAADQYDRTPCDHAIAPALCNDVWNHRVDVKILNRATPYRRFLFQTREPGNSNAGHLYGTDLERDQKEKLIEFLKTL